MNRVLLILVFLLISLDVNALTEHYYSSTLAARDACTALIGSPCASPGLVTLTSCTGSTSNADRYSTGGFGGNAFTGCKVSSNCAAGFEININTGQCSCPTGYYEIAGQCEVQPSDCTSEQIEQVCGSNICTGTYKSEIECWATGTQLDGSGCNTSGGSQVINSSGCPQVCLGDSTNDPNDPANCIDPTCPEGQTVQNHVCTYPQACVGDQVQNPDGSCGPAQCGTGYTENTTTHKCEFSGCPTGTSKGYINGTSACIPNDPGTCPGTTLPNGSCDTNNDNEPDECKGTWKPDGSCDIDGDGNGDSGSCPGTTLPNGGCDVNNDGKADSCTGVWLSTGQCYTPTAPGGGGGGGAGTDGKGATEDSLQKLLEKFEGKYNPHPYMDVYEPTGITYTAAIDNFKNRVMSSSIADAASGLFLVTFNGSCPTWQLPQTAFTPAIDIDAQCSQAMNNIWPIIQVVLAAVATFVAIRWAFL